MERTSRSKTSLVAAETLANLPTPPEPAIPEPPVEPTQEVTPPSEETAEAKLLDKLAPIVTEWKVLDRKRLHLAKAGGDLLNEIAPLVRRGKWGKYLKKHFPLGRRTAEQWRFIADNWGLLTEEERSNCTKDQALTLIRKRLGTAGTGKGGHPKPEPVKEGQPADQGDGNVTTASEQAPATEGTEAEPVTEIEIELRVAFKLSVTGEVPDDKWLREVAQYVPSVKVLDRAGRSVGRTSDFGTTVAIVRPWN